MEFGSFEAVQKPPRRVRQQQIVHVIKGSLYEGDLLAKNKKIPRKFRQKALGEWEGGDQFL
jgi:hypothetical protein